MSIEIIRDAVKRIVTKELGLANRKFPPFHDLKIRKIWIAAVGNKVLGRFKDFEEAVSVRHDYMRERQ